MKGYSHVQHAPRRQSIFVAFLLLVASIAGAEDWRADGVSRVVALSDVHGAYEAMVATLAAAGIVGEESTWTGGNAHLVIVGDLLDRGPRSRDALDLLMRLETEAAAAGGRVHVLIGNHESMNMIGDLRYVSAEEYAAFAPDETAEERDRWYQAWAKRHSANPDDVAVREQFDGRYPAGFFALRRAFGSEGAYGKWLLTKPVIAVINGTAFVHGGLSPQIADIGLEGVNVDLQQQLADYVRAVETLIAAEVLLPTDNHYDYVDIIDQYLPGLQADPAVATAMADVRRLATASLITTDGPLWYRANVSCSGIIEEHRVVDVLEAIGAHRVVVGHTPTTNRRVLERFDGKVIEVDTGMLSAYYRGSGNALVIEGDSIVARNQSGNDVYAPMPHPRQVGDRPDDLSVEALEMLLKYGKVVSQQRDAANDRVIVQVSDGKNTVSALFDKRRQRGFYPDVAAYRLDRMLELDMVPASVIREIDGNEGTLQFFPEKLMDESQRSAAGRGSSATCPLPDQWLAMYIFDTLIYNEGRSQKRMSYDLRNWKLILTEHGRAFRASSGRPPHLVAVALDVSEGWRDALLAMSDEVLEKEFGDVLDKRRLKALGARRDELLADFAEAGASRQ